MVPGAGSQFGFSGCLFKCEGSPGAECAVVRWLLWRGGVALRKCCCYHRCCWRAVVQGYAAAAPDIEPSSMLGAGNFWWNFSKTKANFKMLIHINLSLVEEIDKIDKNFFLTC